MRNQQPTRWIKIGFLIGIGFIIPSLASYILGSILLMKGIPAFLNQHTETVEVDDGADFMNSYMDKFDRTSQIEILSHREQPMDGPVLILGTLKNKGKTAVRSIKLEVELLDENQAMVYECTEYIGQNIKSGEKENFQVRCGCGNTVLPQHASYTIRVTQANSY